MGQEMEDCEFWLPPQFLADDDVFLDYNNGGKGFGGELSSGFGLGFNSSRPGSDLGSPVESVLGSTETESDEDDYLTELTRKMAQSTLQGNGSGYGLTKGWGDSGSPQSTLCGHGSARGNPNWVEGDLDLLHAAAGEVRMGLMSERAELYHNGSDYIVQSRKPTPASMPQNITYPDYEQQAYLTYYKQLQIAQYEQLRQQQVMKQQMLQKLQMIEKKGRDAGGRSMNMGMAAWANNPQQHLKQKNGSGMRAMFLGNSGSRRECAGTGVFLPRRTGTPIENSKMPACSPVLLPDRVAQALSLNFEGWDAELLTRPRFNGASTPGSDATTRYRNNAMVGDRRTSLRSPTAISPEVRLPADWSY